MKPTHIEVEITADPALLENLSAILGQLGFEGFWEEAETLRGYVTASRWSLRLEEEVRSVALLIARASASAAPRIAVREIATQNWNREWEKTIQPIRVTDRIVITPTWHPIEPGANDVVLIIDPKMSFGTGYHETTRLVLQLMEPRVRTGMTILDLGTGTGVLAIAALRLGAGHATGVDIDEWSFENALENVRLNGVADRARILQGDLSAVPAGRFDMIFANIQLNVIAPVLPELRDRLVPNGSMLLSGLLVSDEEKISAALDRTGLAAVERRTENEWLALAVAARHERP